MSIVFIGTVESSYVALEEMINQNVDISAVFTLDKQYTSNVSDFKELDSLAIENNIDLYKFKNINDKENLDIIKTLNPDVVFVIGLSQLIKPELISIPKYGCVGLHPSLLPKNRGRAVIPWSIISGEKETGITLFYIDEGMDTGDIIGQKKVFIEDEDTARTLYDKLMIKLRELIHENIVDILNNTVNVIKQDESQATYCAKRTPQDGYIDWSKSNREIHNLIRATTKPYPGAFTYYKGKKIIIWDSELKDRDNYIANTGQIVSKEVQKGVIVKTGDGLILIKNISIDDENIRADEYFKIVGNRFENYDINQVGKINELMEELNKLKTMIGEK